MHSSKAAKLIAMIMFVINVFVIFIVGCDDLPDNIQQQVQNQPYSWYATDDGLCKYRWENDGSCVVITAGQQYRLLRTNQSGINGPISWKWEQDGDLDIAIGTKQYDLDSPLDSINDDDSGYYEEEGFDYSDTAVLGATGAASAYLMSKKKINDGERIITNTLTVPNKKIELKKYQSSNYGKKIQVKSPLKSLTMKNGNTSKPASSYKISTSSKR